MNLDRIIAVRNSKTVYRDGDRCLKVFNEDYSKDFVAEYIKQDLMLVAGGGYNTEHIHNVKFELKKL